MRGDGGRADVERDAISAIDETGINGDDLPAAPHRHRDLPIARAQAFLQAGQHRQARVRVLQAPLGAKRILQPPQIA